MNRAGISCGTYVHLKPARILLTYLFIYFVFIFISLGGIINIFKLNMWQNMLLEDWNL